MSYVAVGHGTHAMFREGNPVPIGMLVPGDWQRVLRDKIVRVTGPGGTCTIHLVADVKYEEGVTTLLFEDDG